MRKCDYRAAYSPGPPEAAQGNNGACDRRRSRLPIVSWQRARSAGKRTSAVGPLRRCGFVRNETHRVPAAPADRAGIRSRGRRNRCPNIQLLKGA